MRLGIGEVTLVVLDYDEAIAFFTGALGFELHEDDDRGGGKRWVRVAPRDHARFMAAGGRFSELPRHEAFGTVAVFEDLCGNRWDLIESRVSDT